MTQHQHPRLDAFVSLVWYDTLLRFISNFIAKTSELLLAAGLVVSSANFLTDGTILGTTTPASQAWAWAQALAIDSTLAISFYHVLLCMKQRDWVKCVLYSLLTGLLALVAGTITNIDIFSHAIHAPMNSAMVLMGLNIKMLSILRSIAVVGFVLMSRLRDVSFKDLTDPGPTPPITHNEPAPARAQDQHLQHQEQVPVAESSHFTIEDVAQLLQVLTRLDRTTLTRVTMEPVPTHADRSTTGGEPPQQMDLPHTQSGATFVAQVDLPRASEPDPSHLEHSNEPVQSLEPRQGLQRHSTGTPEPSTKHQGEIQPDPEPDPPTVPQRQHATAPEPDPPTVPQRQHAAEPDPPSMDPGAIQKSREERLEHAYQELIAEGYKISGRTLAGRAHMHRSLCIAWLHTRQQAQSTGEPHTPAQEEPDHKSPAQEAPEDHPA